MYGRHDEERTAHEGPEGHHGDHAVPARLRGAAGTAWLPRHRWQIILPGTGEVLVLTEDEFSETWVLESECPPAVRKLFDGFESYARWRWGK